MTAYDRIEETVSVRLLHDEGYRQHKEQSNAEFCTLLKETRKELGMTQRELAAALGFDFSYISKVENGRVEPGLPLMLTYRAFTKQLTKTQA